MDWVIENWELLMAGLGALLTLASVVVKLTPSPRDDEWLRRVLAFVSFLQPRGLGGLKLPGSAPARAPDES